MKEIKLETLREIEEEYLSEKCSAIARHALSDCDIQVAASSKDIVKDMDFNFDINIKTMAVNNQKASGRCWIFAACNVMRELIGKKIGVGSFTLICITEGENCMNFQIAFLDFGSLEDENAMAKEIERRWNLAKKGSEEC